MLVYWGGAIGTDTMNDSMDTTHTVRLREAFATYQGNMHACMAYKSADEVVNLAGAYIATGLIREERCVCVLPAHIIDSLTQYMTGIGLNIEHLHDKGKILLANEEHVWPEHTRGTTEGRLEFIHQQVIAATDHDCCGTRILWQGLLASDVEDHEALRQYELQVQQLIVSAPLSMLCCYCRPEAGDESLLDALMHHAVIVHEGVLCRNHWVGDNDPIAAVPNNGIIVDGLLASLGRRKSYDDPDESGITQDTLTSLPNRRMFYQQLTRAIHRLHRNPEYRFAVLCMDLDGFRLVNDSLGHPIGDDLLVNLSDRLIRSIRSVDVCARLGSDEFAILLEDINDYSDAIRVANRIRETLDTPFRVNGREVYATMSMGIALSSGGYSRAEDMIRDADTAMSRAKEQGKGRCEMFDASMHAEALARLQLEAELRRALERDELRVYYQPIMALEQEQLAGFEALIRWQHPERGLLGPDQFLPAAEAASIMPAIDQLVLTKSCTQAARWAEMYPIFPPISISVNISPGLLMSTDIVQAVRATLQETSLSPHGLVLEIPESMLIRAEDKTIDILNRLKAENIRLHLDDFGTGYSSLNHLHMLPVDVMKIDRSFVLKMVSDSHGYEIVRMIITLAHQMNLAVVAEGVETARHVEMLRDMGCQFAQGYYYARPMPAKDAEAFLAAQMAADRERT